jgi:serine/threonine protein phosphatase PrpC
MFCSIAVSRSIGDLLFKDESYTRGKVSSLIATPYLTKFSLETKHLFLIVACDGIWDFLSYSEAAKIVFEELMVTNDAPKAASVLVEAAFVKGSTDNCTAIILLLHPSFSQYKK